MDRESNALNCLLGRVSWKHRIRFSLRFRSSFFRTQDIGCSPPFFKVFVLVEILVPLGLETRFMGVAIKIPSLVERGCYGLATMSLFELSAGLKVRLFLSL